MGRKSSRSGVAVWRVEGEGGSNKEMEETEAEGKESVRREESGGEERRIREDEQKMK